MIHLILLFAINFGTLPGHPVLTLHNPQPATHIGIVSLRPVAHPIIVTGRY